MKYSYTFATLALAASAVTVYAAPLGEGSNAPQPRSNDGGAPIDHILAARLFSVSTPKQTENKNQSSTSNGTYGGDDPNTNTNSSSSASQSSSSNGDGNNFGGAAGYGGNGGKGAVGGKSGFNCKKGGKRSLASRRAFARRRGQQQNSGNDSDSDDSDSDSDDDDGGSHNTSSKSKSDSHNWNKDDHSTTNINDSYNDNSETYNGGSSGSSGAMNVTGSNGGATSNGPCVNFRRGLIAQERRDEASGLALLRSLGAMTERGVEDPLESLAARDVGYSARMLGVEGHAAGGNARRSFLFDDGLARRDASGLAVRCAQGYEGCSLAMRREAEEMLREHARDLGFHF